MSRWVLHRKEPVLISLTASVITHPNKSNLVGGGFTLVHSSKVLMTEKSRQEIDTTSYIVSARNRTVDAYAQFTFFFLYSPGS